MYVPTPHWEISGIEDLAPVLRVLGDLLGEGALLYLEGNAVAAEVEAFLLAHRVEGRRSFPTGLVLPRPVRVHLPVDDETMRGLAALAAERHPMEVCTSLVAYRGDAVLFHWYDLPDDAFAVSGDIELERVQDVCRVLVGTCRRA